jgi:hypothetical protein
LTPYGGKIKSSKYEEKMFNDVRIDRQVRQTKNDENLYTIYLRVHLVGDGRRSEFIFSTKCYIGWKDIK